MQSNPTQSRKPSTQATLTTVFSVLGVIIGIIFHIGAGKLSYDKFGSIGWAILATIFGSFYYPYYAFFVSGSSSSMLGGMRKMKW